MKCERCGRNEATFYYRSNVNGEVREAHLCEECARELGYRIEDPIGELFSAASDGLFGRSLFGEELFSMPRLTPVARRTLRTPSDGTEREAPLLSDEEQQKLRREREKNALQVALNEALDAEDYERAAALRDELRRFES